MCVRHGLELAADDGAEREDSATIRAAIEATD